MWTEGKNKNMNKILMNFKNPEKKQSMKIRFWFLEQINKIHIIRKINKE